MSEYKMGCSSVSSVNLSSVKLSREEHNLSFASIWFASISSRSDSPAEKLKDWRLTSGLCERNKRSGQ